MVILDGKKLGEKILGELKTEITGLNKKLRLAVVVVGQNPVVEKFINQKRKAAEFLGIDFKIYPFAEEITTNELRKRLSEIMHEKRNTGVIIQLPLPKHLNTQYILNAIVPEKDVDVLSTKAVGNFVVGKSEVMPPVAGAVKALLEEYKIDFQGKSIVIVGAGSLVGKPTGLWFLNEKVGFSLVESGTLSPEEIIKKADVLITGIGKPKFIKGDWIKKGAVVIDAGTSESGGKLSGDVDFESASQRAGFITPVPGGVGPVTVAILFKNLIALAKE
ncbi:MAG: bifunctional 5,10-methylenetetrahydrofolate dehydrogenase/5,10-methenyltetrahydrofolate cyclohydrolase [bacterium]|nr:bifunctional 5,10-methylenetetrahydrofolate dehydrogenase/5,10-methenyltetrahydrofolate cyclohydrolase [bacterium]